APQTVTQARASERVKVAAAQVTARVAAERVQRQQYHVAPQHQRTQTDAEAGREPERQDDVPPQKNEDDQRQPEQVAVNVLQDEGESRLAAVAPSRVGGGARRGRPEERAVVRATVVV